jgi:hypothetical protein
VTVSVQDVTSMWVVLYVYSIGMGIIANEDIFELKPTQKKGEAKLYLKEESTIEI